MTHEDETEKRIANKLIAFNDVANIPLLQVCYA